MKPKQIIPILVLLLLLGTLAAGSVARAQSSPNYNLEWHTISSGGGTVASGNYIVGSIMGGPTSGAAPPASDNYVVQGGFVGGSGFTNIYRLYLPLVIKF
jgi:hypothetical protein